MKNRVTIILLSSLFLIYINKASAQGDQIQQMLSMYFQESFAGYILIPCNDTTIFCDTTFQDKTLNSWYSVTYKLKKDSSVVDTTYFENPNTGEQDMRYENNLLKAGSEVEKRCRRPVFKIYLSSTKLKVKENQKPFLSIEIDFPSTEVNKTAIITRDNKAFLLDAELVDKHELRIYYNNAESPIYKQGGTIFIKNKPILYVFLLSHF